MLGISRHYYTVQGFRWFEDHLFLLTTKVGSPPPPPECKTSPEHLLITGYFAENGQFSQKMTDFCLEITNFSKSRPAHSGLPTPPSPTNTHAKVDPTHVRGGGLAEDVGFRLENR